MKNHFKFLFIYLFITGLILPIYFYNTEFIWNDHLFYNYTISLIYILISTRIFSKRYYLSFNTKFYTEEALWLAMFAIKGAVFYLALPGSFYLYSTISSFVSNNFGLFFLPAFIIIFIDIILKEFISNWYRFSHKKTLKVNTKVPGASIIYELFQGLLLNSLIAHFVLLEKSISLF